MTPIKDLSPPQCILLAASLAADSNIKGLYQLTPARQDVFDLKLLLRILLTCLPESLEPARYITYIQEVSSKIYLEQHEEYEVDTSQVDQLSEVEIQKKLRKLSLKPLEHPSVAQGAIQDPLVNFLIHRAHNIDMETGLLPHVPKLLEPFLDRSYYLRDWFCSAILPLVRFDFEYYPDPDRSTLSLTEFEGYAGDDGVQKLLARTLQSARNGTATDKTVGRDFRGILGPWISGSMQRKRRKLHDDIPAPPLPIGQTEQQRQTRQTDNPRNAAKVDDWQPAFKWIVDRALHEFPIAVKVIEGWDGPIDVDMGGYQKELRLIQEDDALADELRNEYCQSAFAAIYAAPDDKPEVLDGAHAILCRLAELLHFEPPPDLATSIHSLPKVEVHADKLEDASLEALQNHALLAPGNPLTIPKLETFSLLQMLVYSAYQLSSLGHSACATTVAKIRFWSDRTEQLRVVDKILNGLVAGAKRTDEQWNYIRDTFLWLWDWAIDVDDDHEPGEGAGIFGKVSREEFERKILEALCKVGLYDLAIKIYLNKEDGHDHPLPISDVEKVLVKMLLHEYDGASNGNRTRGGMKKASDVLAAFRKHLPDSVYFRRCAALISATHAMSFYSLALQQGVPFRPASIRKNNDPVSFIAKILEQNQNSYTKLDDLIEIGRNLVIGHLTDAMLDGSDDSSMQDQQETESEEDRVLTATRRVTGMAIDAALASNDFDTAYSYTINRLTPQSQSNSSPNSSAHPSPPDDISWRAALAAGKYRFPHSPTISPTHRLQQRMDLLSHALLLAPAGAAIPEVLATWRRCEEELLAAREADARDEEEHDSAADNRTRRGVGDGSIPGGFGAGIEPVLTNQPKRDTGAVTAAEEAPMGLFDVARGAAAALGRSTGGLGGLRAAAEGRLGGVMHEAGRMSGEFEDAARGDASQRVRKRDMVASAVTGGLASGLGWVLGATPVQQHESGEER